MKYAVMSSGIVVVSLMQSYPNLSVSGVTAGLLCCLVFAFAESRSVAAGDELIAMLTGLYFVPSSLINLTEGALFDVIKVADVPVGLLRELAGAVVAALFVTIALRRLNTRGASLAPAPP